MTARPSWHLLTVVALLGACVRPHPVVVEPSIQHPAGGSVELWNTPVSAPVAGSGQEAAIRQSGGAVDSHGFGASVDTADFTFASTGPGLVAADSAVADSVAVPTDSVSMAVEEALVRLPVTWDIEVRAYESMDAVTRYVDLFTGTARERIAARLERGTRYEAMIRQKLREGNLPEDMYYLALIESGFDPNAYSRAAAVGMWQFMTSTAKGVGLRVDWWVDERRDPVRSTDAAVTFLRSLNAQFGSMYLAAAAYNGGPGRISRGLARFETSMKGVEGDDRFFVLASKDYLARETKDYVPQLIASALIGKEPEKYGLDVNPQPAWEYDSVVVAPLTPLAVIARAAGSTLDEIKELNPHILRGMTPPKDSLLVWVPAGSASFFESALAEVPEAERIGAKGVKTKEGESMAAIAKRAGFTAAQLNVYNPAAKRLKNGNLVAGQSILVPTSEVVSAALNVPDPAIERYGTTIVGARTHKVVAGDNLGAIARTYGTTVAAIKQANSLKSDLIRIGQVLVLPGSR